MTELAYMVREDRAQRGTAMVPQSAIIRGWLGDLPLLIAVNDRKKYGERSADREFVRFLFGDSPTEVISFADLDPLSVAREAVEACVLAVHPYGAPSCEALRQAIAAGRLARVFVIVWAPTETVRTMLDGMGATNLHIGTAAPSSDLVQLEAARCMVEEQYNGLASGNGKDAVVQLVRAFTAEGYPLDVDSWLRAFFAAGGEFDEAMKVKKLIEEMQRGVRHRLRERYRPNIVEILRRQVAEDMSA
jgi:hypothetical protein